MTAADVAAALPSDEICDVLVDHHHWSYDRYEQWLTDALTQQLLRCAASPWMVKDLRIASSLFERVDFDAPISQLVREQFAAALAQLDDRRADLSRSIEDRESRGGVRVPPPRPHTSAG